MSAPCRRWSHKAAPRGASAGLAVTALSLRPHPQQGRPPPCHRESCALGCFSTVWGVISHPHCGHWPPGGVRPLARRPDRALCGISHGSGCLTPAHLLGGQGRVLSAGARPFANRSPWCPELTVLSWPLQVDSQTEENNDMNKRRRKGFNNLDEVGVHRVSFNKDCCLTAGSPGPPSCGRSPGPLCFPLSGTTPFQA